MQETKLQDLTMATRKHIETLLQDPTEESLQKMFSSGLQEEKDKFVVDCLMKNNRLDLVLYVCNELADGGFGGNMLEIKHYTLEQMIRQNISIKYVEELLDTMQSDDFEVFNENNSSSYSYITLCIEKNRFDILKLLISNYTVNYYMLYTILEKNYSKEQLIKIIKTLMKYSGEVEREDIVDIIDDYTYVNNIDNKLEDVLKYMLSTSTTYPTTFEKLILAYENKKYKAIKTIIKEILTTDDYDQELKNAHKMVDKNSSHTDKYDTVYYFLFDKLPMEYTAYMLEFCDLEHLKQISEDFDNIIGSIYEEGKIKKYFRYVINKLLDENDNKEDTLQLIKDILRTDINKEDIIENYKPDRMDMVIMISDDDDDDQ